MKNTIFGNLGLCGAAFMAALAASMATTANAALHDYEPFDYVGATTLNDQGGGTGWNGGWIVSGSMPSIQLSNDGVSLAYPAPFESPLTTPATTGSRVSTGGLGSNAGSFRLLSETIDLSQDGNVAYVSALFKKTAANGGVNNDNILIEFFDDAANPNRRFGVGIAGADDKPWLNANGSTTADGPAVTPGDTYFMVAKIVSAAAPGLDTAYLKVYGTGYGTEVSINEPTTWDATLTQNTAAILDRIRIRIDPGNAAGTPGEVDEIRVGTTWASVIGVNETFDPADFDEDGDVDGADLAQWKNDFGGPGSDADDDGDSDGNDFLIWQRSLTEPEALPEVSAVPEPSSIALLALALAGVAFRAGKRGRFVR